jgi:hypothetical protein
MLVCQPRLIIFWYNLGFAFNSSVSVFCNISSRLKTVQGQSSVSGLKLLDQKVKDKTWIEDTMFSSEINREIFLTADFVEVTLW